ncbi:hypothetical protein, partial [Cypionkella sp.]|uniref:hypothetical protein n=1 Tax=Cypionkella sp. TaxID=2811411 RepID=UPI0027664D51|nr:hypothetical protein [Cypionkella sp.]
RIGLGQSPAHADGLGTLPRKYECAAHLALLFVGLGLPFDRSPCNVCAQSLCKAAPYNARQA